MWRAKTRQWLENGWAISFWFLYCSYISHRVVTIQVVHASRITLLYRQELHDYNFISLSREFGRGERKTLQSVSTARGKRERERSIKGPEGLSLLYVPARQCSPLIL